MSSKPEMTMADALRAERVLAERQYILEHEEDFLVMERQLLRVCRSNLLCPEHKLVCHDHTHAFLQSHPFMWQAFVTRVRDICKLEVINSGRMPDDRAYFITVKF